ncbi:MAG TPA: fumarate reductase/succinate dehydrogenase flavoprotein subunit, partial [Thermoanaerobaculia bacterium]
FILPNTVSDYIASTQLERITTDHPAFRDAEAGVSARTARLMSIKGTRTVDSFHRELGKLMWDHCGMARTAAGLKQALERIPQIREQFWEDVNVPGSDRELNQALEKAWRVADYLELAELMCIDALHREESAGGHFRVEYQTAEGEAERNDNEFLYVAAWEHKGEGNEPVLHKEPLVYEEVKLATRSYK